MPAGDTFPTAVWDEIIARMSDGEPLQEICRTDGFPKPRTVYDKRDDDAEFAASFGRARDLGYDAIAARLRDTARGRGDSQDDVQRDKLIIETDLKLLAKWDPRRYGDKITNEHTGRDGGPIETITRRVVDPKGPDGA